MIACEMIVVASVVIAASVVSNSSMFVFISWSSIF